MRLVVGMQTFVDRERIDLRRGGSVVSSFAGAFGSALLETQLTAMLGYVIALDRSDSATSSRFVAGRFP